MKNLKTNGVRISGHAVRLRMRGGEDVGLNMSGSCRAIPSNRRFQAFGIILNPIYCTASMSPSL